MNNLFLVCVSKSYYNNKIFDLKSDTNRDDYYYPFYLLKKRFFELGVSIDTFDFFKKSHSKDYGLIFFDIPKNIRAILKIHKNVKKYLVIFESEMLLPQNYNKNLHTQFEKVFTWNDDLVDSGKYVKFFWPNKSSQKTDISSKKKLCSMIVANKTNKHHLELYSERLKAIEWFEQNRPEDFDLFGFGWDRHYCKWPLSKLNKLKTIRRIFKPYHISYRGEAKSKLDVLKQYKFSICYENARDIPGYITEKIFDCFFAGCVPIYWGAPNILDYLPENIFIDRRRFNNYDELYDFIKNMPDKEYENYLFNIRKFIKSEEIYPFSAENFVEIITGNVLCKNKDVFKKSF